MASHAERTLFSLPQLSYDVKEGLMPAITPKALDLHVNKHHQVSDRGVLPPRDSAYSPLFFFST